MKKILLLIACVAIFAGCENNKTGNQIKDASTVSVETENETNTVKLTEETPTLKTKAIKLGRFKQHENGHSIGDNTEMTELEKQLKIDDWDVIEISYVWDCSPKYNDMPMLIRYDRINNNLTLIYVENNVKEEYSNIVQSGLSEFLKNKETSFYSLEKYCKAAGYDFNNREMRVEAIGEAPRQSGIDGSVDVVVDYIKQNATDKSSIEFIEWSKVSPFSEYWVVRCEFSGKNTLGETLTSNTWFYIQNNKVVKTK